MTPKSTTRPTQDVNETPKDPRSCIKALEGLIAFVRALCPPGPCKTFKMALYGPLQGPQWLYIALKDLKKRDAIGTVIRP